MQWMIAALLAALPAAALAQTIPMRRGEAVTLIAGDDDAPHLAGRSAIAVDDYEAAVTVEYQRGDYDAAVGATSLSVQDGTARDLTPVPTPGQLTLRFVRTPGKDQSLLSIRNGLGGAFAYRATITVAGKAHATDVCVVPPGKDANEFWPDAIERIEIADLRLVRWNPGDRITCE